MSQNLKAFSSDAFYFLREGGDRVNLLTALEGQKSLRRVEVPSNRCGEWGKAKEAWPGSV